MLPIRVARGHLQLLRLVIFEEHSPNHFTSSIIHRGHARIDITVLLERLLQFHDLLCLSTQKCNEDVETKLSFVRALSST